MSAVERAEALLGRLDDRAPEDGRRWLHGVVDAARAGGSTKPLLDAYPAAARRVGKALLDPEGEAALNGPDDVVPLGAWSVDVAARAVLLLAAAEVDGERLVATVDSAYDIGDSREKIAVVRALSLLPDGARFVPVALDAGRTNDMHLFGALATDNPFPGRHFPELELDKLVMKAAFVGAPIDRIIGLTRRANPELARMGMDYIDQQESAIRSFPPELWLAIAPHAPPGAVARMIGRLGHALADHRRWAARGLAIAGDPRSLAFVEEQLEVERDEAVRVALRQTLEALTTAGRARHEDTAKEATRRS